VPKNTNALLLKLQDLTPLQSDSIGLGVSSVLSTLSHSHEKTIIASYHITSRHLGTRYSCPLCPIFRGPLAPCLLCGMIYCLFMRVW